MKEKRKTPIIKKITKKMSLILQLATNIISLLGAAVIIYAASKSLYEYICIEIFCNKKHSKKKSKHTHTFTSIRHSLNKNFIFGLEILIASDIVRTIITPSYRELGFLSIIVIIRTVLHFSIIKDDKEK